MKMDCTTLEGCCSIQLSYGQKSRKKNGRGERIRTFDPLVPNQMRYQAALRPDSTIVMAQSPIYELDASGARLLFQAWCIPNPFIPDELHNTMLT
jgi:hypothetical protein